ncbi:MAG TPA: hypothetical protein VHF58_03425 [Solirubrobacterales bacterium]|nr:hypothetical protein [Solirubrobacterales bacterium]
MTTLADRQPNATGRNHVHTRAFLAGGAATTALLAGAILLFSALAAYVAFNGIPGDPAESSTDATVLVGTRGAPEAAAQAVARAPESVARTPTAPTPVEPVAAPEPAPATSAAVAAAEPETTIETGSGNPETGTEAAGQAEQGGALEGTVGGLENTAGNLGIDVPLDDATNQVTGPLDQTLNNTLNNVGGLLGNPNLGDQVGHTLNNVTNTLLGPGGLTDQILGGGQR